MPFVNAPVVTKAPGANSFTVTQVLGFGDPTMAAGKTLSLAATNIY